MVEYKLIVFDLLFQFLYEVCIKLWTIHNFISIECILTKFTRPLFNLVSDDALTVYVCYSIVKISLTYPYLKHSAESTR